MHKWICLKDMGLCICCKAQSWPRRIEFSISNSRHNFSNKSHSIELLTNQLFVPV